MNFSAGLSLFTDLVLINLGSIFGSHTDSSVLIYETVSLSNLAAMILVQWPSKVYNTHWENFSWNFSNWNRTYILWIYLTQREKSDVIGWVEEEHEIVLDKGFFKELMS